MGFGSNARLTFGPAGKFLHASRPLPRHYQTCILFSRKLQLTLPTSVGADQDSFPPVPIAAHSRSGSGVQFEISNLPLKSIFRSQSHGGRFWG
jgi:hypothetical protein